MSGYTGMLFAPTLHPAAKVLLGPELEAALSANIHKKRRLNGRFVSDVIIKLVPTSFIAKVMLVMVMGG